MKRWIVVLAVILAVAGLAACATATPAPTATTAAHTAPTAAPTAVPPTPTKAPAPVVLELEGPSGVKSLTMDDLKALPAVEGWGGIKSSTGRITVPELFKGVLVQDLCNLVGGIAEDTGVNIVAKDGYAMTISYNQIANSAFITYDPGTGDEVNVNEPLKVVVAYERDGKPLDAEMDGTLRLMVLNSKNNQVVDGHWSVKWVTKVAIKSLAKEWVLRLEGITVEDMDRGTFESCSAPKCHGATWKDEKAQEWAGVPLWWLVGRVDDDNKHGDDAYNKEFAAAGYTVEVVAADGYSATLDSARVDKNSNLIIAYSVNGNPLDDNYFPLRLVGADATKKELVGQIAKFVVKAAAPQPTATPVPPTPEPVALSDIALKMADLKAMDVVKLELEHPKSGKQPYEGVRLNAVLDKAGVTATEGPIVFVASDGFMAESTLAEIRACKDCLVAFDGDKLNLAMPGLASKLWIKDVVKIQAPVTAKPEPVVLGDIALKMADLKAMDVVKLELEHPKSGKQTYEGVRLNAVLDKAGVTATEGPIVFVASDGFMAESTLAEVRACADCLVAFDGDKLNLAMPGLASKLWVKDVVKIQAPVSASVGGPVALTVAGAVDKSLQLTMDALKAMDVVTLELEHPKQGKQSYTGVRLNGLLDKAGVKAGAATLACMASDGYKSEVALSDVRACKDCLVIFAADGSLGLAMPGLPSSAWAKALVSIELK